MVVVAETTLSSIFISLGRELRPRGTGKTVAQRAASIRARKKIANLKARGKREIIARARSHLAYCPISFRRCIRFHFFSSFFSSTLSISRHHSSLTFFIIVRSRFSNVLGISGYHTVNTFQVTSPE